MKQVKILCGISGSGKSTLAGKMMLEAVEKDYHLARCSADNYFYDLDENYKFDPSKIADAHGACLREYTNYVHNDYAGLIVVDNTNTTVAEVAPYAALALANGYDLEIIILLPPKDRDALKKIAARNVHGCSVSVVEGQWKRLSGLAATLLPWWPVRVEEVEV